jgi:hypothetical protein
MVTTVLTPAMFAKRMNEIAKLDDEEECHTKADDLMCDLLKSLGYDRGVKTFMSMERFYA